MSGIWQNYILSICWGGGFNEFSTLNNFNRTGFILGCENWVRYDFKALSRALYLVIWDRTKNKLVITSTCSFHRECVGDGGEGDNFPSKHSLWKTVILLIHIM